MKEFTFYFHAFPLLYTPDTGEAVTHYPDGLLSGVGLPAEHDQYHGNLLGLTPGEHHLHHELAHHLVGELSPWPGGDDALAYGGCPIARLSATGGHVDPEWARDREWLITAVQYGSRGLSHGAAYAEERMGRLPAQHAMLFLTQLMKAKDVPGASCVVVG
jgi:hypothetical protein